MPDPPAICVMFTCLYSHSLQCHCLSCNISKTPKILVPCLNAVLNSLIWDSTSDNVFEHEQHEKNQPALYTIDFPSSFSVGQTISIPYTFSWYHPDGAPLYIEDYPRQKESFRNIITVHISDEFTLLNNDKIHLGGQGDMYGPHFKNWYKLYVNYSEDGTSGSIDLRLDKPLLYDRDIVSFGFEGSDKFIDFQTQRTVDGLIFVKSESLTEQYDMDQLAFTTWHMQWIYGNGDYTNDNDERYDWYYHSGESHTPQIKTASQIMLTQPEVDFYIPNSGWNDFADYLRFAIPLENTSNVRVWLLEQGASEEFVNDFLIAYPEFAKTMSSQGSVKSRVAFFL